MTGTDNITSIGNYVFYGCYSIENSVMPSNVRSIGDSAFRNCFGLTNVTIPDSVTSIGNNAFTGCYGISEYHLRPVNPPTIGANTFSSISSDCIIYVPYSEDHSVLEAYKTATNWSTYASKMQEEPA